MYINATRIQIDSTTSPSNIFFAEDTSLIKLERRRITPIPIPWLRMSPDNIFPVVMWSAVAPSGSHMSAEANIDTNKNGNNYLITGIVLSCDGGISVAPNLRMVNYENTDKDSEMEYKVNLQFKF